jgi:phosphatidylserine decarboxylase
MSMLDSIRKQVTPIHPEGYIFIALFAIVAMVLHWLWSPLGWLGGFVTLW